MQTGSSVTCNVVKAVEMRLPGGLIGGPCLSMRGQLIDDGPRQGASAHIVQRRVVDDTVCVPSTQQIEEVQPALAWPGGEPGEVVIADLRAEAVLASMARAGIVHQDPGRRLQAGPQHVTVLTRNPSCPAINRCIICPLQMATPIPPVVPPAVAP
jgi:hypothetical protein